MWKPNKGVQITEIEEELYMAEFGDKKDKKKIGRASCRERV